MVSFLKLIRLPNLLIIFLVQFLARYTIIIPFLASYNVQSSVDNFSFFLLVLSTVFIAAGGYIVNDYYDLQIDSINKAEKIIIGKDISKEWSLIFYGMFTLSGIAMGFYLSFVQNVFLLWQVNILSVIFLLLYSALLKKISLVGNIVISFLSSLTIYMLLIIEKEVWVNYVADNDPIMNEIPILISAYSIFAFIMTWIREVIKDMEDRKGDAVFNRKTLPIVAGIRFSKYFAAFLILVITFSLVFIQYIQNQWEDIISFLYVVLFIEAPLLVLLYFTISARIKKDFTRASILTKGIMLTGILSMLVFYLRSK